MFHAIKARLVHVSPTTLRYRLARRVLKEQKLRDAKACVFYWVYLPVALVALVFVPFLTLILWTLSLPVAWLSGFERTGASIFPSTPDAPVTEIYRCAHVRIAPWRVVLPLVVVVTLVALALTPLAVMEFVVVAGLIVVALLGWIAYRHWAGIGNVWDRICPYLEVNETSEERVS